MKYTRVWWKTSSKIKQEIVQYFCLHYVFCNVIIRQAYCLRFAYSLTMCVCVASTSFPGLSCYRPLGERDPWTEIGVPFLEGINHNFNSANAMKSRRSHRIYFYLQNILIWLEKSSCFEKNNMKTSFTRGLGNLASLGTLPPHKQSLRKPLWICKIACVSELYPRWVVIQIGQ